MTIAADAAWMADNWARLVVALTSTGTLTIALKFYATWRKGRSDDGRLDLDRDAALNDHTSKELAALREQIIASGKAHADRAFAAEERYRAGLTAADTRHRDAMAAADAREAACHAQVSSLRDKISALSEEIVGLRRQLGQVGRSAIIVATHAPSDTIRESADRAAEALDNLDTARNPHD